MTPVNPSPDPRSADAALAALLLAIDPLGLGGAVLRGAGGPYATNGSVASGTCCLPGPMSASFPPYVTADRLLGGLDVPATSARAAPCSRRAFSSLRWRRAVLTSAERLEDRQGGVDCSGPGQTARWSSSGTACHPGCRQGSP